MESVPPTMMKPNFISMTATVESLIVIDVRRYHVVVRIRSAVSNEGLESPLFGDRLELAPQFVLNADSSIDSASARNERLLSVRQARRGESFSGTILQNPQREWILIDLNK